MSRGRPVGRDRAWPARSPATRPRRNVGSSTMVESLKALDPDVPGREVHQIQIFWRCTGTAGGHLGFGAPSVEREFRKSWIWPKGRLPCTGNSRHLSRGGNADACDYLGCKALTIERNRHCSSRSGSPPTVQLQPNEVERARSARITAGSFIGFLARTGPRRREPAQGFNQLRSGG